MKRAHKRPHLSPKKALFIDEYLRSDFNATQAYIRAGYSRVGARQGASRLLKNADVAAEIAAKRAAIEFQQDRSQIADMREIQQRLTEQLRGESYQDDLAEIEARIDEKDVSVEKLRVLLAGAQDTSTKALLHGKVLDGVDSIIRDLLQLKQLRLAQQAESNKAAVVLLKVKGAFDPRRPPMDDPNALLNMLVRNILKSGINPKELMDQAMAEAQQAVFTLRLRDPGAASRPAPGAPEVPARPGLFVRALPEPRDPPGQ